MTYRPTPVRPSPRAARGRVSRSFRIWAPALILSGLAALAVAVSPAAADRIKDKEAEAQQVLAQLDQLDRDLGTANERLNQANYRLEQVRAQLKENRYELSVARRNLQLAQRRLAARLLAIYVDGPPPGVLEIALGTKGLDDALNQGDTADRVAQQDVQVAREVLRFRKASTRRVDLMQRAHAAQRRVVAQRQAYQDQLEAGIAERQRLYASIKDEVVRLKREEAARQARIAAEVRARLARQRQVQQAAVENTVVGATASTPEVTVAPPSQYTGVVGIAMQYLGVQYVWGGSTPSGFDCSGFVMYVYAKLGVSLPHSTYAMWNIGVPVGLGDLQPGDLVYFDGLGHMGIYIGGGQFIHAPHTGDVVKISSMSGWYSSTFVGGRRIL